MIAQTLKCSCPLRICVKQLIYIFKPIQNQTQPIYLIFQLLFNIRNQMFKNINLYCVRGNIIIPLVGRWQRNNIKISKLLSYVIYNNCQFYQTNEINYYNKNQC